MDSDIRLLLSKTEDFGMTEKQKKMLGRIIAAFVLFVALLIAEHTGMLENVNVWIQFVIYLVPYLIIGYDIVYKAVRNISHGQVFDENFLMMVATVGAFGVQEFSEAVAVMLFYQVGTVPELCGRQIQTVHLRDDGYLSGICQHRAERRADTGRSG